MCHTNNEKGENENNGRNRELPNQENIRILGEKENYKFLGILEAEIITQEEKKEKK